MKLWATTVSGEKITRSLVYEYDSISNEDEFVSVLQQVCEQMDVPTPVVTYINFNHYVMFNNTRFKPRDFVEYVDFDHMTIENVVERKKK